LSYPPTSVVSATGFAGKGSVKKLSIAETVVTVVSP